MATATKKNRPAKKGATKKPTPKQKASSGDLKVVLPGEDGFESRYRSRNGRDAVSPVLDPIMMENFENDVLLFQIPNGDPFSVQQVRSWARRWNKTDAKFVEHDVADDAKLRELGWISVSGDGESEMIQIELKPMEEAADEED